MHRHRLCRHGYHLLLFPDTTSSGPQARRFTGSPAFGGTIEEGIFFALLCYAVLCFALCAARYIFGGLRHILGFLRHTFSGNRLCIRCFRIIGFIVLAQAKTRVDGTLAAPADAEQVLLLDVFGSQDAVAGKHSGIEQTVVQRQPDDALHIGGILLEERGSQVVVKHGVDPHVIALARIDERQHAQEDGKRTVALALHDAPHQTVLHNVGVEREIVQSLFFDSHGFWVLSFYKFFRFWV